MGTRAPATWEFLGDISSCCDLVTPYGVEKLNMSPLVQTRAFRLTGTKRNTWTSAALLGIGHVWTNLCIPLFLNIIILKEDNYLKVPFAKYYQFCSHVHVSMCYHDRNETVFVERGVYLLRSHDVPPLYPTCEEDMMLNVTWLDATGNRWWIGTVW